MSFRPVDRLPLVEWATWWDKTIDRWKGEGLPPALQDQGNIREFFGLDAFRQWWISPRKPSFPAPAAHGRGFVAGMADYERLREHLYPEQPFDVATVERWAERQARGELVVWISLDGFFWFPRTVFGIQQHLYAFYDLPDVMHAINRDLLEFQLRAVDQFCRICRPDFVTFGEDMSYNHGPMISRHLFDEFMAPYYRRIVPHLKRYGIIPFVDSDGEIADIIPWYADVGVDAFLPLERQAGVDLVALRREHPRLRVIGAYDKMVMTQGEATMRREFERLLPVMRQGGYVPSVDHQTPPGVSLAQYRLYLSLLQEYCREAASG